MGHKQHPLIPDRIKCRQVCLSHAGGSLHQTFCGTFCPALFQSIQCFNLGAPRLKQQLNLCIRIFFHIVIMSQIFRYGRFMPVLRISCQFRIVNHNGMVFKQIHKRIIKQLKILRIILAVKPIIPLDAGSQCTSGNIGRSNVDFPLLFPMKDVRFGVKGTFLVTVESQIHPIP